MFVKTHINLDSGLRTIGKIQLRLHFIRGIRILLEKSILLKSNPPR